MERILLLIVSLLSCFSAGARIPAETVGPGNALSACYRRCEKIDTFRPGIGLGLPVCRLIAGRLGGKIYLDSSYAAGAKFVVVLPYR